MDTGAPPAFRITPHLVFGLMIIFLGIIFTLDNLDITDARTYLRYWPAALVALGLTKLWNARESHGQALGGFLFLAIGSWLLLDNLELIDVSIFAFWPLLLVLAGGAIVWQGLQGRQARGPAAGSDTVNAIAVLAGVNRGSNSSTFRGGELTAFMGGCEIDLRQAAINGEAVIDVFAMWGGIEIRVPENWTVIGRVTPIMGGYEDATRPAPGVSTHRLVIRGLVLMGGVEIKN